MNRSKKLFSLRKGDIQMSKVKSRKRKEPETLDFGQATVALMGASCEFFMQMKNKKHPLAKAWKTWNEWDGSKETEDAFTAACQELKE